MTFIEEASLHPDLAVAAYAEVTPNISRNAYTNALQTAGMSQSQAETFAKN
jgi:hypothetical protein